VLLVNIPEVVEDAVEDFLDDVSSLNAEDVIEQCIDDAINEPPPTQISSKSNDRLFDILLKN
jgi:hypothetical protein